MATHKIGKMEFDISKKGLAFRFGEGNVHRLGRNAELSDSEENGEYSFDDYNNEDYAPEDQYGGDDAYAGEDGDDYAPENGYSGRFARRDDRYDDDYADDGDYADGDDGYDDGYDGDYADGGYDGGYADDGYDDGGYDGDYADGDGYYDDGDDRYRDADADDYPDGGDYEERNPVLRYIEYNSWVTFALLFILPPLGIYFLWRYNHLEKKTRYVVSGVSAVWFVVLIVLLIMLIGGTGDQGDPSTVITDPISPVASPTATIAPEASVSPSASAGAEFTPADPNGIESLRPDATATPIPGGNGGTSGGTTTGDTVYMPATGLYYHKTDTCTAIESGVKLSKVTLDVATARKLAPCPVCYEGQTYCYATANGKYYHYDQNCSGMTGAVRGTVAAAENQGKTACPVCVTGKLESLKNGELKFANATTTDMSGITVYATQNGKYFHRTSDCSGMSGARSGSLLAAMLAGKTACPTCCASAGELVYATRNGTYYHSQSNCSGMEGAYQITLAEALILGKAKCPVCLRTSGTGDLSPESIIDDTTVYVYGTKGGRYYHSRSNCSGMTNASRYTLKAMLQSGRAACPECCQGADTIVYATPGGTYYHSYASCSGMENASSGTVAYALAYGYQKCPNCWNGTTPVYGNGTGDGSGNAGTTDPSISGTGVYVYATAAGRYYHTQQYCSGMTDAQYVPLSYAVQYGKTACPTCAAAANYMVYSNDNGTYYHATSDCSGMTNAKQRTIQDAMLLGQTACPTCVAKYNAWKAQQEQQGQETLPQPTQNPNLPQSSGTFTTGTSGIKVYARIDLPYYHTLPNCSGMTDASYITLETALNYGKTGCPVCAEAANTTVYAVPGGKYYHYSSACAGSGASSGTRAAALAYGFSPCPYCVSQVQVVSSNTFTPGTSGIKVYASLTGRYYHASESCAGAGASYITLETALNYGKEACPSCAAAADKTVYAEPGGQYYHVSASCAGSRAVAGGFARALAYGMQPCPLCIGGSEAYEESDVRYAAAADTTVYIDLDSSQMYYHTNARCSDAGLSGGTGVMLEFVIRSGYHACPYCTPPTDIG